MSRDLTTGGKAPPFLSSDRLERFFPADFTATVMAPIPYQAKGHHGGGGLGHGYDARILPITCEIWLKAREAAILHYKQLPIAARAEQIMRALAHVGIYALVDEATGYQDDRARDELQQILAAYIVEELRPWVHVFPHELFRQIYRLQGWEYREGNAKRPMYVGKLINRYIYDRLPPGVHEELRRKNPAVNGRRRHKHHQYLTEQTGIPHLDRQIAIVTTLMKVSDDRRAFNVLFQKAFPTLGEQVLLEMERDTEPETSE